MNRESTSVERQTIKRRKFQWGFLQVTILIGVVHLLASELATPRAQAIGRELFLLSAVLASMKAARDRPRFTLAMALLWTVSALCAVAEAFPGFTPWDNELRIAALSFSALIGAICAVEILKYVFNSELSGTDSIFGAIVAYLMLVHAFAQCYGILAVTNPAAFRFPDDIPLASRNLREEMLYFSLATMTTLGYGDIAPLSDTARSLAMIQAVTGQFYMGVIVAVLAGIVASSPNPRRAKKS